MRSLRTAIFVLTFLGFLRPTLCWSGECINWAKVLSNQQITSAKGKTVAVEPFTNYTKNAEDEWLVGGLPELISAMLSAGTSLAVLNKSTGTDYTITGMFQNIKGTLRAFIKVYQGNKNKLLAQYTLLTPYPNNREFFTRTAEIVKLLAKNMGTEVNQEGLNQITNRTASTQAYENYVKGLQALRTYNLNEIEVARIWFEQTRRADYKSELGYDGLIELLTFLGYYHKQRREPFGSYFEEAQKEITKKQRLLKKKEGVLQNRFLLGNEAFTEALMLSSAGKLQPAIAALKKSVEYVPEDAISWYQLARIYERTGQQSDSTAALQKAYAINPCIEQ